MSEGKHFEIERKYLILPPDEARLLAAPGCEVWQIEQIYLDRAPGIPDRIRRVTENGAARWYKTSKHRLSDTVCEEEEARISEEEYAKYRESATPTLRPIVKTRYRVPYAGRTLEVDVYPFWTDRAILEIELEREDEPVRIPDWLRVVREVTGDRRYKNIQLAGEVPMDPI